MGPSINTYLAEDTQKFLRCRAACQNELKKLQGNGTGQRPHLHSMNTTALHIICLQTARRRGRLFRLQAPLRHEVKFAEDEEESALALASSSRMFPEAAQVLRRPKLMRITKL